MSYLPITSDLTLRVRDLENIRAVVTFLFDLGVRFEHRMELLSCWEERVLDIPELSFSGNLVTVASLVQDHENPAHAIKFDLEITARVRIQARDAAVEMLDLDGIALNYAETQDDQTAWLLHVKGSGLEALRQVAAIIQRHAREDDDDEDDEEDRIDDTGLQDAVLLEVLEISSGLPSTVGVQMTTLDIPLDGGVR